MEKLLCKLKKHNISHKAYVILQVVTIFSILVLFTVQPVYADDIWTKANAMFKDIYNNIVKISTGAAVVVIAISTLLTMFSKNGRTVDEARSWRTRAFIAWAIINGLGFVMAYLIPLFQGGQWTGN